MQDLYNNGSLSVAEVARRTKIPYSTVYFNTRILDRGFPSSKEYRECMADNAGFSSQSKYKEDLAKRRGFESLSEYQEYLVNKRGFKSLTEYEQHLAKERQEKPLNKELGNLLKRRLVELKRSQVWLSRQLEITQGAVSRYVAGKTTPKKSLQKKLFDTLGLPYETLDDLKNELNLD